MNTSHWVRVFKISYRKDGKRLIREANVKCETVKSGLYTPGDKTFLDTSTHVTVHLVVPYFEEPKTDEQHDKVDQLYAECEKQSDDYLRQNYPNAVVSCQSPP